LFKALSRFFLPLSLTSSLLFLLSSREGGTLATKRRTRERAREGGRERWEALLYHVCKHEWRK